MIDRAVRTIDRAVRTIDRAFRTTDRTFRTTDRTFRTTDRTFRTTDRAVRTIDREVRRVSPWLRTSPSEEAGDGAAEGGFEDGGLAMGEGEGDFAQGFVRGALAGDGGEVGGAVGVLTEAEFEGAAGFFTLVEELGLELPALEDGEDAAEVGEAPFHCEFVFPVELLVAGLRGGIEEDGGFGAVELEADDTAAAAGVRLVDGVVLRALGGGGGAGVEGGFVHGIDGMVGFQKNRDWSSLQA
jgi:hypothetical protein